MSGIRSSDDIWLFCQSSALFDKRNDKISTDYPITLACTYLLFIAQITGHQPHLGNVNKGILYAVCQYPNN